MTPEEVVKLVTRGTTQFGKGRVKCLFVNERFALVQWPSESLYSSISRTWVSSWVERHEMADLLKRQQCRGGYAPGQEVWCSARGQDGPLTAKRKQALIERELQR